VGLLDSLTFGDTEASLRGTRTPFASISVRRAIQFDGIAFALLGARRCNCIRHIQPYLLRTFILLKKVHTNYYLTI
jgi:hypothetical protein